MAKQSKPFMSISEHIELLRSRGLEVDEALARQWLENVSYYRLSAYWYPARKFNIDGRRSDQFKPGIKFTDVVHLYEADRKLRTLIHDGMERIEIAFRARIIETLCNPDPLAYSKPSIYRDTFDHPNCMKTISQRINRASGSDNFIKHYKKEYSVPYPFWVVAEVLNFGDLSKLYAGLRARDQRSIAESFGFIIELDKLTESQCKNFKKNPPLASWLEQLVVIRNICAHHSRLWNRSFVPASTEALKTIPDLNNLPPGQSERLFGAMLVMAKILNTTSPGTTWPDKLQNLIRRDFLTNPLVQNSALGIPDGMQI